MLTQPQTLICIIRCRGLLLPERVLPVLPGPYPLPEVPPCPGIGGYTGTGLRRIRHQYLGKKTRPTRTRNLPTRTRCTRTCTHLPEPKPAYFTRSTRTLYPYPLIRLILKFKFKTGIRVGYTGIWVRARVHGHGYGQVRIQFGPGMVRFLPQKL